MGVVDLARFRGGRLRHLPRLPRVRYLDTWHGIGTLLLLPVFAWGMVSTRRLVAEPLDPRRLVRLGGRLDSATRLTGARLVLLAGAGATSVGGLIILWVGLTYTFVPEDLEFIGLSASELRAINPRLVPLIAHDRAGFGGAVFTLGLTTLLCLWCARPSPSLRQAIAAAGGLSVGAALLVQRPLATPTCGTWCPSWWRARCW